MSPHQMDPGRLALLMDALLTEAPPEVVEEFRRRLPTHGTEFDDQMQAAVADTDALAIDVSTMIDARRSAVMPADVPAWVRLGMFATLAQWGSGTADTCMHNPSPARPEPVTAVAWKPGLVACPACGGHLFRLPRNSDADRRCDGCGRVTRGLEHDDGIIPSTVQMGALLYTVGACSDCAWGDPREDRAAR